MQVKLKYLINKPSGISWDELGPGIWKSTSPSANGLIIIADDNQAMFFCNEDVGLQEVDIPAWQNQRFIPFNGQVILEND